MANPRDELQGMWNVTMGKGRWDMNDLMLATAKLIKVVDNQSVTIRELKAQVKSLQADVEKAKSVGPDSVDEYERLRRQDP